MATIIAVSSLVARGGVGLRAILPASARLGHEVIACPTILLSSHLGHTRTAGAAVAPETLASLIQALDDNGWLGAADAVLTGYLPSAAHVRLAADLAARVRTRRPEALVFCDPVLGDQPHGLYVPAEVAEAVRNVLVPQATHVKPNAFELSFLSGRPAGSPAEAVAAARALGVPVVLASSVPAPGGRLANVLLTADTAAAATVPFEASVPHGTGDLLTALFAAHCLSGAALREAAGAAAAGVARVLALSRDADELRLWDPSPWHAAAPLSLADLATGNG